MSLNTDWGSRDTWGTILSAVLDLLKATGALHKDTGPVIPKDPEKKKKDDDNVY